MPRAVPLGPPGLRRRGTVRHGREAGDSRSATGFSPPRLRLRGRASEAPRLTRAPCRLRLITSTGGALGGSPCSARREAARPGVPPAGRPPARRGASPLGARRGRARGRAPPGCSGPARGRRPSGPRGTQGADTGGCSDMAQQRRLGFAHHPFGPGDANGNSWSEKMNVWLYTVGAADERERRFVWECQQAGTQWQADFRILPRWRRAVWGREVRYSGKPFRNKRDAKEDACRLLLEEQRRLRRFPGLTTPTLLLGHVAKAPGQGAAGQPAAEGDAGQAGRARPRPRTVAAVAKVQPPPAGLAPNLQQDAPLPSPAAGQDPLADGPPRETGAGTCRAPRRQGRGPPVAAPARTRPVLSLSASCSPEPLPRPPPPPPSPPLPRPLRPRGSSPLRGSRRSARNFALPIPPS